MDRKEHVQKEVFSLSERHKRIIRSLVFGNFTASIMESVRRDDEDSPHPKFCG